MSKSRIMMQTVSKSAVCWLIVCSLWGCGYDPMFDSDEPPETKDIPAPTADAKSFQMSDEAFRVAAKLGNIETLIRGLEAGIDVDGSDPSSGMSPLHLAAHDGRIQVVRLLIDHQATVDLPDAQGHTPLLMAAYNGHTNVVRMLKQHGAQIDARDAQGKTPLIHASSGPYAQTVEMLLDSGADINAVDSGEGFTALMTAAALGQKEVVELLLQRGADKTISDGDGDTAMSHAQTSGNNEIVELLK